METFKIQISPGFLISDIIQETYNSNSFGVYSGMSYVLSGGTNGSSLLTGLTIPFLLKQDFQDVGYYSVFDGNVAQINVSENFIFIKNPDNSNLNSIRVYNTSENSNINYLSTSYFQISWGDGSAIEILDSTNQYFDHNYADNGTYTIILTHITSFGQIVVEKDITLPYGVSEIDNIYGTVTFQNQTGNWSNSPSQINFYTSADTTSDAEIQIVSLPYTVSGQTKSKLGDIKTYGGFPQVGTFVPIDGGGTGRITDITTSYTAYTINDLDYIDYSNGTSIFKFYSSGLTESQIEYLPIVKSEVYLNIIDQTQILSNVFVERGKNSALENFRRIGEVRTLSGLEEYGYKFFNVIKTQF
jgi:hypothetical protein